MKLFDTRPQIGGMQLDEVVVDDLKTTPDKPDKLEPGQHYARQVPPTEALEDMPPNAIRALTVRARGKIVYQGPPTQQAGDLLDQLMREHGRKLHITAKLIDGTKRRYRGNVRVS